ncbi:hypothetical protein ACFL4N_08165 [Thermodesulfobacteriota bacterium]
MELFEIKENFQVEDEALTFKELVSAAPEEIADALKDKDVVILPSHGTKDVFYSGSLDTLDYLNENKINTDIYTTDEEYKELALHGDDIWLGTFFIKNFVIPIFCSVIASFIYQKLKSKSGDKISLKFIVEKKNGKTASVSFDGKVEDLNKALDAVKEFSDES